MYGRLLGEDDKGIIKDKNRAQRVVYEIELT